MKTMPITLLTLSLLAVFVGCRSKPAEKLTIYEVPTVKEPTPVATEESAPAVVKEPTPTALETLRVLQVNVQIRGAENGANLAAPYLKNSLDDELAANGFSVIEDDASADLRIRGQVLITDQTKRGSRIVIRGMATVSFFKQLAAPLAGEKAGDRLISTKTFEVKSPESYSAEEAILRFGMAFDALLREWIRETGSRVAAEIGACEIAFSDIQAKDADPEAVVNEILKLKGVYDCRIAMDETDATKMSAAVIYEKRHFPNGILGQLNELKKLKVKGEN